MMRRSLRLSQCLGARGGLRPARRTTTRDPPGAGPCRRRTCQGTPRRRRRVDVQPTSPLRARVIRRWRPRSSRHPQSASCIEVPASSIPSRRSCDVLRKAISNHFSHFLYRRQDKQRTLFRLNRCCDLTATPAARRRVLAGDLSHILWTRKARGHSHTLEHLVAAERLLLQGRDQQRASLRRAAQSRYVGA